MRVWARLAIPVVAGCIRRPASAKRGMQVTAESIDATVPPSGTGCAECDEVGGWWFHLRRCTQCGHISARRIILHQRKRILMSADLRVAKGGVEGRSRT